MSSALDMYRRQGGNAVGFFAQQGLNDAVAAREAAAELAKPGLWKSAGEILSDAITTGVRRAGIDEWSGGMPSTSGGARGRRGVDWSRYKFDTPSSSVALGDSPYGAAAAAYDASGDIDQTLERAEKLNVIAAQTNDWYSRLNFEGPTLLDRLFGDVEAIDAQAAAIMALGGAWNGVASGISAGYAALVDGTGSAAEAAKRAIADTLKAEGASMAVLAIKETGLGVASLALGPIGGASAAAHFKAAAVLAGGAVLAGAAASALGTSNSVAAAQARGSAPASAPSGGSAQTAPQTQVTIVTGDALSDDSPRMRRLKAERMWARARGTTGVVQE
ncbi:MAG: hypothetical protein SFX73_38560 [Kofleriaceae bacterium]|nr:hypothetical protein [Kofleriaceae bacterium]